MRSSAETNSHNEVMPNRPESSSLRPEIQATDSTCAGWAAKSAATAVATQAACASPETDSTSETRSKRVEMECTVSQQTRQHKA